MEESQEMVTMNQGIKEVRETGSRFVHRLETGVMSVFNWMSGPAMTEQDRIQLRMAETESYRRYSQPAI